MVECASAHYKALIGLLHYYTINVIFVTHYQNEQMSRVHSALEQTILSNDFLSYGLQHGLLNLKQVARFIQASMCEALGREMSVGAIHMGLSRWQKKELATKNSFPKNIFRRLFIQSDLCVVTYAGPSEITSIFDTQYLGDLRELVTMKPSRIQHDACGVGLKFKPEFLDTPGLIYKTLEQIYLKQISLIEITSTHTELNLYLRSEQARKAMDVLYYRFVEKN